ncbi:hypothetical protein HY991_03195 [Candidatus Micrarchaeota archaeon]|nr:hypothetical protein [Candidatus Micrarchaeota archaeon]
MVSLVFDSSSLIAVSETCNIEVLYFLKERTRGNFLIAPIVKDEIILHPIKVKKFELSAVRLKKLLLDGVVSVISSHLLVKETREIMDLANGIFHVDGKPLKLVHDGEAASIAVFSFAKADALVVDEKTTRLLLEAPFKMRETLQSEYEGKLEINEDGLKKFREKTKGIFVLRSSELVAMAAKKGFFKNYRTSEEEAFRASIYALRQAGCSLTSEELKEYEGIRL